MDTFYVDISVKVLAESPEDAEKIAGGAAIRMEAMNPGIITLKGVEADHYTATYVEQMPYDHFHE